MHFLGFIRGQSRAGLLHRITMEPGKCGGQPCIRGQRIRVTDILELLSHGASHEEILADYSFLEPEGILAAIACHDYATKSGNNLSRAKRIDS